MVKDVITNHVNGKIWKGKRCKGKICKGKICTKSRFFKKDSSQNSLFVLIFIVM